MLPQHQNVPSIRVSAHEERHAAYIKRTVNWAFSDKQQPENPIEYVFEGHVLPFPLKTHDFAVAALLFKAMRTGHNIYVDGPVSKRLLANLEEFQRIWNKWRPDLCQIIKIAAAQEIDEVSRDDGCAILAYSGGVDANFSLVSHCSGYIGRRARNIKAAVLIHGFDILLDQKKLFDLSVSSASQILDSYSIPLATITTNWKQNVCDNWELEFGAAMASCLFQFQGHASACLLGSDEDYSCQEFIWGSNPVSNQYLSGMMQLETDGAGFTRTEKVALLANHPQIRNNLRVCWEGPSSGNAEIANCGRCEKCIRTKLNFYANKCEPGGTLRARPTLSEMLLLKARNAVQIGYLLDILRIAKKNGINEPWVPALKIAVFRSRAQLLARDCLYRPAKKVLKNLRKQTH